MDVLRGMAAVAIAGVLVGPSWRRCADGADAPVPVDPVVALHKAVDAARTAPKGDKAAVAALTAAMGAVTERVDEVRRKLSPGSSTTRESLLIASTWNDAVTAARFHGMAARADYVLDTIPTFKDAGISLSFPRSDRWTYRYTKKSQHILSVLQKSPSGKTVCEVKVWFYRWDTDYSGVGGENYVKLAKVMLEADRAAMEGARMRASPRVTVAHLNSEFPRAQFYSVEGLDPEEDAFVRRLNYYLKDKSRTYNVELVVHGDSLPEEDAITSWQRSEACPERQALLQSIASVPEK